MKRITAKMRDKILRNDRCPHAKYWDDDPYHRANPPFKIGCPECRQEQIKSAERAAYRRGQRSVNV